MKRYSEFGFAFLLAVMLASIYFFLGWRVAAFAGSLSSVWFIISMILLTRPPGIPEFVQDKPGSDEQYVVRRDIIPKVEWIDRLRLSLGVSCGCCLLIWLTLTIVV